MYIELPKENMVICNGMAEVKDGMLYVYGSALSDIMFELTYIIHGNTCYYCNNPLTEQAENIPEPFRKRTIDHLIPRDFGGPSITNNLRPCCLDCNSKKGNMFPEEFELWGKIKKIEPEKERRKEMRAFKEELKQIREQRRYGEIPSLPNEWISEGVPKSAYVYFYTEEPVGAAFDKAKEFYRKYRRIQRPLIFSKNGFLLDGFNTLLYIKYTGVTRVHSIILDNVIYAGFNEYNESNALVIKK